MNKNSLPLFVLAGVAAPLILQLACGGKGPAVNSGDEAQVASASRPTPVVETAQSSNANTAASIPEATGTPVTERAMNARRPPKPTRSEVDENQERYRQMAAAQGSQIGNGPNDTWLWVITSSELRSSSSVFLGSKIKVDVDNGVVTLRGTVLTTQQSEAAEETARNIDGVASVKNELTVTPPEMKATRP